MRISILLMMTTLLLISCNNEKKLQGELYKEVMDIHDEVMPQMSSLKKLSKTLSGQVDEILADSISIDSVKVNLLIVTTSQLSKANESMMDWMHQFKQVEKGTPHGEVMKYLMEQKESISKVRDKMMAAKKEAEKYIIAED